MKDCRDLSKKFRKFFRLSSSPVAVTLSQKKAGKSNVKSPGRFCEFVRKAAFERKEYVIKENDLSSFTPRIMLGFSEPQYVDIYPRVKPSETESVRVKPLERSENNPDIIVIISNPSCLMEILQTLHKSTNKRLEASCTSEGSAIAGEAVALPYMEEEPNLTLLCGGARSIGGYRDEELAFGIPFETFKEMSESLAESNITDALCGCLMDDIPNHVKEAFTDMGFDKGTDHFFGRIEGRRLRFYLDKDKEGSLSQMSVHYPLKLESEEEASQLLETAREALLGEGLVRQRENWLDLVFTTNFSEGMEKAALDEKKFKKEISGLFSNFVSRINEIDSKAKGS